MRVSYSILCLKTVRRTTPQRTPPFEELARIDLFSVPSSEPIEFGSGYLSGLRGDPLYEAGTESDLGEEYDRGYRWGVGVRRGEVSTPRWDRGKREEVPPAFV